MKNVIEQALIRAPDGIICPDQIRFSKIAQDIPIASSAPSIESLSNPAEMSSTELPLDLAELEKEAIKRAMTQAEGNVSEAARLLGIGRGKLYKGLSQL